MTRKDGVAYGFTDHDRDLTFDGAVFKASSGMDSAGAAAKHGLSVDNSETVGALSHAAVDEADLAAGRFDGAEVRAWLVNWADTGQRIEQFRGSFGEISRAGGAFKAELRGLTDQLNQPQGRYFSATARRCWGMRAAAFRTCPGHAVEVAISGFDALGRMLLRSGRALRRAGLNAGGCGC